ncbi:uncharacterized protein LOC129600066 [Paramacrobiotus metropolitanus]|uniref:uncharacterized protein LOC129600066 n=1 Tax=Paramacrobiotus metropolitanus TaxID=2943436 RepID=UPI00244630DF|nr:uncharacterized protein LOC129600066 [Paramacrobiotus metropolitanus]
MLRSFNTTLYNISINSTIAPPAIEISGTAAVHLTAWFMVTTFIECLTSVLIILLISAILYRRGRPSHSSLQILHMLVLELIIVSIIHPTLSVTVYFPSLALSLVNCRNFYVFYIIVAGAEQWASFLLSVNRCIAIVFPLHFAKLNNRYATIGAILTGWIIMTAWTLPVAIDAGWRISLSAPWNICTLVPMTPVNGRIFQANSSFGIYFPISGTIVCYLVVLLSQLKERFNKCRVNVAADGAYDQTFELKRNRRMTAAKMLFGSSLWYLACYLPHIVITVFYRQVYADNPPLQLWMRVVYNSGYIGTPSERNTGLDCRKSVVT